MGYPRRLKSEPVPWKTDSGAVMFGRRKGHQRVDTQRPGPGADSEMPWATTFENSYGAARHPSDRFSQFNAKPGGPNAHTADAYFTTQNEVGYGAGLGGAADVGGGDLGPIAAMVKQRSKNRDAGGIGPSAIGAHAGVPRKRLNGPEPGVTPNDIHAVKFDIPAEDLDDHWPEGHRNRKKYVPFSQAQPVGGKTAPSTQTGGGYGAHASEFAPDRAARSRAVKSHIDDTRADDSAPPPVKGAFSAAMNTFMISHANEGPARDVLRAAAARHGGAEAMPPLPPAQAAALRRKVRGLNLKGFEDI